MEKDPRKSPERIDASKYFLIGNNLGLDFINTEIMQNGQLLDLLETPEDLLGWAVAVKLMELREAEKLWKEWKAAPSAESFLAPVKSFRKTLREAAVRLADGKGIEQATIAQINERLRAKTGFVEIAPTEDGYRKIFRSLYTEPEQLLAPVAESAADLLCYGEKAFLKKCENPGCILYFYDTTKNHRRRWCSMSVCGNRAKAAAFYERKKQGLKAK